MSSKRLMQLFLTALVGIYVIFLTGLFIFQRQLMYFPAGPIGSAASFDMPHAETLRLKTPKGQTIVAWYQAASPGKPIFLYFHGNGGTLGTRTDLLQELVADGSGLMAIDYEGYGGSTGTPSEAALIEDGETAYAAVRERGYAPDRIVIIGESLGTGVAVAVAAHKPIEALVLDSAYSSTADVAAAQYWIFPVRLLMRDTFESIDRIKDVTAPKLFLHGMDDPIIPIRFGRRLFDAAPDPKTFIALPDRGHMTLWIPGMLDRMRAWLADLPRTTVGARTTVGPRTTVGAAMTGHD